MRSLKKSFSGVSFRKSSKHITITVLVLLLTFSIVLAVPDTNEKTTQVVLSAKTSVNSNGDVLWNKTYGGSGYDYGYSVVESSDGGYIITGTIIEDLWLIKTDKDGNQLWNQTYGGDQDEEGRCVEKTDGGGYIIVGSTESFSVGGTDVWLIKTNSTGGLEWNQSYGGSYNDWGYSVMETSDGGYIITGHYAIDTFTGYVWLIKTDANGDHQWNQTYGEEDTITSNGYCVVETSDGGYIITGETGPSLDGYRDVFLIKTNSAGDLEWSQTFGETDWDSGQSVLQSSDGGYVIAGYTESYGVGGSYDVWLIKTNSTGGLEWNQTYGGTYYENAFDVAQASDGGYIIIGSQQQMPTFSKMTVRNAVTDALLIKTDENGNQMWNRTYAGSSIDIGRSVIQTSDGDYVIAGDTYSYSDDSNPDVWLLKVASGFPVIDHPADITYEEDSTGNSITWQASDAEPSGYTVTRNETVVESGPWAGGNITVSVDSLSVGVYLYTCTVNDTVGQSGSDTVIVTVTEDGGFPWVGFGLALALIGLAAVIIYQTQYAKKP